jgi:hypothetical protein
VLFTKYKGDQIKNDTGGKCSTLGEDDEQADKLRGKGF